MPLSTSNTHVMVVLVQLLIVGGSFKAPQNPAADSSRTSSFSSASNGPWKPRNWVKGGYPADVAGALSKVTLKSRSPIDYRGDSSLMVLKAHKGNAQAVSKT
ncbi:hypothetical protein BD779DRAFT_1464718 [Infundibulicybe gibba]|nr:hypothetical protein BD779DRAFT_1464718 [Infundibulicybe gibba]